MDESGQIVRSSAEAYRICIGEPEKEVGRTARKNVCSCSWKTDAIKI